MKYIIVTVVVNEAMQQYSIVFYNGSEIFTSLTLEEVNIKSNDLQVAQDKSRSD